MKTTLAQFRFTPFVAFGLAALFVSVAGTNAYAAQLKHGESYAVKVQYNLSDLATDAGAAKVYGKLKRAARRVCFETSEQWDARRTRHYWECYKAALAKAVDDVKSTNLTALHQQDGRQKRPG
jgi:UrcA family protein